MRSLLRCSLALILFITLSPAVLAAANQTVIWYLPHPDDETIGMADSIYQSVNAGNTNFFIYFSHGESSLARHYLRGPDGSTVDLGSEEFGTARMRETLAALAVLGVHPGQVLFLDYPDGNIPREPVEQTMRLFAQLYPGSIHRTVSLLDPHEDHQTVARALAALAREEGLDINPEYFHVYIYRLRDLPPGVEKRPIQHKEAKERALAELSLWDPDQGRYGIAAQSTPDLVAAARRSLYEYVDASTTTRSSWRGATLAPGVSLSNQDLGAFLRIGERFSLDIFLEYVHQGIAAEVSYRLRDEIPLVQLVVGAGYHFGYGKPYITSKAELAQHYFVRVRHVFQTDTSIAIGLSTKIGRN